VVVQNLSCAQGKLLGQVHIRSILDVASSNLASLNGVDLDLGNIKEKGTELGISTYGIDRSNNRCFVKCRR
jgi:hypothetical protein